MNKHVYGLAALSLVLSVAANAADAPVGNPVHGGKINAMCSGCHGIDGYRTAFPKVYHVPKIAGQHAEYIISALKSYQNGSRNHPSMRGIAGSLSDQDMADLAAYYSTNGDHK